jgi:hypothetical protein
MCMFWATLGFNASVLAFIYYCNNANLSANLRGKNVGLRSKACMKILYDLTELNKRLKARHHRGR